MIDYDLLCAQAKSLILGVPHLIADLSNVSALIFNSLERVNWAGFYIVEADRLILGPFQGKPACVEIPFGRGVCGTAAKTDSTLLVYDVHEFQGHIACDSDSNSEIVVPIHSKDKVVAVLDVDSPDTGRFTRDDLLGLEKLVKVLENEISGLFSEVNYV